MAVSVIRQIESGSEARVYVMCVSVRCGGPVFVAWTSPFAGHPGGRILLFGLFTCFLQPPGEMSIGVLVPAVEGEDADVVSLFHAVCGLHSRVAEDLEGSSSHCLLRGYC